MVDFKNFYLLFKYAQGYGHERIRPLGISDTEYMICSLLRECMDLSQDDLAHTLHLDKGTIARALSSLEQKGYVTRVQNIENRRKKTIHLTPEGEDCIADVVDIHDKWLQEVSRQLSAEEIEAFDRVCLKILSSARQL